MIDEHGLITVETVQRESLPEGAKLFLSVDGVLRTVTKIIRTRRGLRAVVKMPIARRVPVEAATLLVISYCNLAAELAAPIIRASLLARLPFREFSQLEYVDSNYAGLHCG